MGENEHDEEKMYTLNRWFHRWFVGDNSWILRTNGYDITMSCGKEIAGIDHSCSDNVCDRFRLRFKTNYITKGGDFSVGFVDSWADDQEHGIMYEDALGVGANESGWDGEIQHSAAIYVKGGSFFLCDKDNDQKELSSQLSSNIEFPVSGQEWLIEFDFVTYSLSLFLRMSKQWTLATKVEAAFSVFQEDDVIEIM